MARDKDVWGEDAALFKAERWIAEDGSLQRFDQWKCASPYSQALAHGAVHSFNGFPSSSPTALTISGGPRVCLGQNLATYEGVSAHCAIVKNFDLSYAPGYLESTVMTTGIIDNPQPTPLCVFRSRRGRADASATKTRSLCPCAIRFA